MFFAVATQIFFFHIKMALENQTTLELMSKWMRAYDFYEKNHLSGKIRGKFSVGKSFSHYDRPGNPV
jgi:hypothetical protein